jgi:hypothetical protein
VVAHQQVRKREEAHRQRERRQYLAALGKLGAERHRDEPDAGRRVGQREQAAEAGRREERASEDVLRLLSPGLPRGGARKENREDRAWEEEADARERRRRAVTASFVAGEARFHD